MKTQSKLIALGLIVVSLLLTSALAVLAGPPPLPSSFYGTVKVDGANVPDGTTVSAWINGQVYAEGNTQTYEGESFYAMNVPGDDPTTPDIIEGGVEGDSVVFYIGDLEADQTGTWHSGTNQRLDLVAATGTPSTLFGDMDGDGDVDVADIMLVASRWSTSCDNPDPDNDDTTPNYDAFYDLDGDCDIDIVDIMLVAAHWGETCGTGHTFALNSSPLT